MMKLGLRQKFKIFQQDKNLLMWIIYHSKGFRRKKLHTQLFQ